MVGIVVPVGNQPESEEDDRRSTTSTVASTVGTGFFSVASRLAGLQLEFHDKLQEEDEEVDSELAQSRNVSDSEGDYERERERADAHVEERSGYLMSNRSGELASRNFLQNEDGLGSSTQNGADSPQHTQRANLFQMCSRLFVRNPSNLHHNVALRRITMDQLEELRSHGYTVVDNFIAKSLAHQIRSKANSEFFRGRMTECSKPGLPPDCLHPDRLASVRGDHAHWLTLNKPPADSSPMSDLLVAFQELQEDLQEYVRMRKQAADYQVAVLPSSHPHKGVPRHRDAPPDGGRGEERKITAVVFCGSETQTSGGGSGRDGPAWVHGGGAVAGPPPGGAWDNQWERDQLSLLVHRGGLQDLAPSLRWQCIDASATQPDG
eukprot:gene27458-4763_t